MNFIEKEMKLDQQALKAIQADIEVLQEELNDCINYSVSESSDGGSTLTDEEKEYLSKLTTDIKKAKQKAQLKEEEIEQAQKDLAFSKRGIADSKELFAHLENAFSAGNLEANSYEDLVSLIEACDSQIDYFEYDRPTLENEYPILDKLRKWKKRIKKQIERKELETQKKQEEVSLRNERELINYLSQVFVEGNLASTSYQELEELNNTCIKYIHELSAQGVLTPKQNQVLIELEESQPKLRDELLQREQNAEDFKEGVISLVALIKIETKLLALQTKIEAIPEDGDGKSIEELEQELKNCNQALSKLIAPYQIAEMPDRAQEKTEVIEKLMGSLTQKIAARKYNIDQEYKGKDGSDLSRIDIGCTKILVSANSTASSFNSFLLKWYNSVDELSKGYPKAKTEISKFKKEQKKLDDNIKLVEDAAASVAMAAIAAPVGSLAAVAVDDFMKSMVDEVKDITTNIAKDLGKDVMKQLLKSGTKVLFDFQPGKGKLTKKHYTTPTFDPSSPGSGFDLATILKTALYKKFDTITKDIDAFRQKVIDFQVALPDKELLSLLPEENQNRLIEVLLNVQQRIAAKWDAFNDKIITLLNKEPNSISENQAFNEFYYLCWCAWISTFRKEGIITPTHKIMIESNCVNEMARLNFFNDSGADQSLFEQDTGQYLDNLVEKVMPSLTGQSVSKLVDFANTKLKEYTSANYWKNLLGI